MHAYCPGWESAESGELEALRQRLSVVVCTHQIERCNTSTTGGDLYMINYIL